MWIGMIIVVTLEIIDGVIINTAFIDGVIMHG
jgi:hypothetical protein